MGVKLSVIIASYNHQDYIAETLRSLDAQTFQDFEIIMIDDGSTDRTVEVAKSVSSRANILVQENQGVNAARNRGVGLSKGEYLCFVDSDDTELPDRFERQIAKLESDPELGLLYSDALIIDAEGNYLGKLSDVYPVVAGDVAEKLVTHYCFVPFATVMVRKKTFLKTGLFESSRQAMGHMKWIEIAHISKTYYDPKPLACRRRHQTNTSRITKKEDTYAWTREGLKKVLQKYPELQRAIGNKLAKRFARSYLLTGFFLAAEGDVKRARHYYYKAVKTNPSSLVNWGGAIFISLPIGSLITKLHRYFQAKNLPW